MGPSIVPGNRPLSSWQQRALAWVGRWGGRDVVLAVDLTESVGLNDAGRLHLRQIVEKTLDKGHNLHVIPFATSVHSPQVFHYQGPEDIPKILAAVPMSPGPEQGTDIKCAELAIYRYLAELNQQRLQQGQPIKAQSVVWVTDAPLHLPQGKEWVEAPNSPCGLADQPLAAERDRWLAVLPMSLRQMPVGQFQLSVVDIAPTVQEFCTPKPGGGEVCPVNSYLWGQLWWQLLLGGILGLAAGVGGVWSLVRWVRQQIPWFVTVRVNDQEYHFKLKHGQKIGLGGVVPGAFQYISLPSLEPIGYLQRLNQTLRIYALSSGLMYNDSEITRYVSIPKKYGFVKLNAGGKDIQVTF